MTLARLTDAYRHRKDCEESRKVEVWLSILGCRRLQILAAINVRELNTFRATSIAIVASSNFNKMRFQIN